MSWKEEQSTLPQRMALEKMYARLGWSTKGIRDFTKADAADAFVRCHAEFDKRDKQPDGDPFNPYNDHDYGAYKQS